MTTSPPQPQVMKMSEDLTPDLARMREVAEKAPNLIFATDQFAKTFSPPAILSLLDRIAELEGERDVAYESQRRDARYRGEAERQAEDAEAQVSALQAQVERLTRERDHWKANHADVARKKAEHERISKERYEALTRENEGLRRAMRSADMAMLQMHDWIAEETHETSRISWSSKAIGDLRAALPPTADEPAKGDAR